MGGEGKWRLCPPCHISDSSNSLLWHFSVKFVPSCLDNISNPHLNFQMVIFRRSKHSLWIVKACDMHFQLTHILNWTLPVLQKRRTCLLLDWIFLPPVSVVWAHLSYCDRGVCRVVEGRIPTSPQGGWRLTTKHSGGLPTWKRKNTSDVMIYSFYCSKHVTANQFRHRDFPLNSRLSTFPYQAV